MCWAALVCDCGEVCELVFGRGRRERLAQVLRQRPDLTALLYGTDPEPPHPSSELDVLPNVHLSSHIAGALNDEVVRTAHCAMEEYLRWGRGEPLRCRVMPAMLETMA